MVKPLLEDQQEKQVRIPPRGPAETSPRGPMVKTSPAVGKTGRTPTTTSKRTVPAPKEIGN